MQPTRIAVKPTLPCREQWEWPKFSIKHTFKS